MYKVIPFKNQVPQEIHKAVYDYLQTCEWHARLRHCPVGDIKPQDCKKDLTPYITKKTAYLAPFGRNYTELQDHAPIATLFDYVNNNVFGGKFELAGKPLGSGPMPDVLDKEWDDYLAEKDHAGHVVYMEAQPYETVKRSRVPKRDWDNTPLDSDKFYTITFNANLEWNPVWHSEVYYYDDAEDGSADWLNCFSPNLPGHIMLHDSRVLHTSKPTSVLAKEVSQRVCFRVKLKEGETLDL